MKNDNVKQIGRYIAALTTKVPGQLMCFTFNYLTDLFMLVALNQPTIICERAGLSIRL